jgi:hypothetical protein
VSTRKRPRPAGGSSHAHGAEPKGADLWRPPPPLPEVRPIRPSTDPSMLARSLGDPPLGAKSVLAGHYLAALLERAAGTAVALAVSADLLASDDSDG